ncbi:hypothetical protein GLYMA_11G132300v4 [Glycine max]|uniref:Uncharacterized protein n=1 Tax=Glycine max TaxID=3847 RepID=K7LPJ6_SOYBN|nr:hypothetical protein JHK85_031508 [Glycine max]KHN21895.1 Putative inactive beta-glucosidase 33 [Glycine soja]KAG4994134.1 hypothetical protein JHK86_030961 [Glycine max]KAG5145547.1 hypothetical protein JHK84_031090 [Glycine max]KAH1158962.1 hypothetical protein GYH30_030926 [Glycine max]
MQKYALGNLVIVLSTGGYASGGSPPNRRSKCFANCTAGDSTSEPVTHHLILAHAAAVKVYREKFQKTPWNRMTLIWSIAFVHPLHDKMQILLHKRN